MTIDEALAKAAAQIDEIFARSTDNLEGLLIEHGATDEELAAEMARQERLRAQERVRMLAELRVWLQRGGQPLQ